MYENMMIPKVTTKIAATTHMTILFLSIFFLMLLTKP